MHPDDLPHDITSHSFRATTITDLRQAGIGEVASALRVGIVPGTTNDNKAINNNTNVYARTPELDRQDFQCASILSHQHNVKKGHNPRLVSYVFVSYSNCEDLYKKVTSGLFLNHFSETDYGVLKSLLANVLRWHVQLTIEKDIVNRDKFPVFSRVFNVFLSFSASYDEVMGLSKKIYDDYIEQVDGFNIEDVSDLVDQVELIVTDVNQIKSTQKDMLEVIKDTQSKMNKLCDYLMLNNTSIDDLSSLSSSNSSLVQPLPKRCRTSKLIIMPPDSSYFRDTTSEMPLELSLTKCLIENWIDVDLSDFSKNQRKVFYAVKRCFNDVVSDLGVSPPTMCDYAEDEKESYAQSVKDFVEKAMDEVKPLINEMEKKRYTKEILVSQFEKCMRNLKSKRVENKKNY